MAQKAHKQKQTQQQTQGKSALFSMFRKFHIFNLEHISLIPEAHLIHCLKFLKIDFNGSQRAWKACGKRNGERARKSTSGGRWESRFQARQLPRFRQKETVGSFTAIKRKNLRHMRLSVP